MLYDDVMMLMLPADAGNVGFWEGVPWHSTVALSPVLHKHAEACNVVFLSGNTADRYISQCSHCRKSQET